MHTLHRFAKMQPMKVPYMDVSKNRGTPKSSILIGFSLINHAFWGTPIFGNTHMQFIGISLLQVFVSVQQSLPCVWHIHSGGICKELAGTDLTTSHTNLKYIPKLGTPNISNQIQAKWYIHFVLVYTYALKVSMPFWKRLMENFGNFADGGGMLTLDGKKKQFHRELACRHVP